MENNSNTNENEELNFLINYKDYLEKNIISMELKIQEYKNEFKKLEQFIKNNCNHNIETDYIDSMTNYRLSDQIKYCTICKLSF